MVKPPHAQMKAPSGPRNPSTFTDTARSGELVKVVHRIR
jgi:hypothetical protein